MEHGDDVYEATQASVAAAAVRHENGCLFPHGGMNGQEVCIVAAHVQVVSRYKSAGAPRAQSSVHLVGGNPVDDMVLEESYEAVVAALQPEIWRPW